MFNNLKYKIKDKIYDPILKENVGSNCPINNLKAVFKFYKTFTLFEKFYNLPFFITTVFINLKKIYND